MVDAGPEPTYAEKMRVPPPPRGIAYAETSRKYYITFSEYRFCHNATFHLIIWVFTVCLSTRLGISNPQMVKADFEAFVFIIKW